MASTFADIQSRVDHDPAFLGKLIVDPKKALSDAGISIADPDETRKLEQFVASSQLHIAQAGNKVNLSIRTADWGIGAGCCNSNVLNVQ